MQLNFEEQQITNLINSKIKNIGNKLKYIKYLDYENNLNYTLYYRYKFFKKLINNIIKSKEFNYGYDDLYIIKKLNNLIK